MKIAEFANGIDLDVVAHHEPTRLDLHCQGPYASGKCQGNLKFFKVSELSGNFIICQGKLNFC